MYTLPQAAKLLGIKDSTLRHQMRTGKLHGIKIGREWVINADEIERYRRESLRGK